MQDPEFKKARAFPTDGRIFEKHGTQISGIEFREGDSTELFLNPLQIYKLTPRNDVSGMADMELMPLTEDQKSRAWIEAVNQALNPETWERISRAIKKGWKS